MTNNTENLVKKAIKGRVLFTGSGTYVIDDIMKRIPATFESEKCPATDILLAAALKNFHPHIIVACLSDESRQTLRMFSHLEDNPESINLLLLVIGNKADCKLFENNILHKNIQFFVRPLDAERFLNTLNEYLSCGVEDAQRIQDEQQKNGEELRADTLAQTELVIAQQALMEKIELMTRAHGRKTILVVDDDVRMLNIIKLYLQDLYEVVVVPSGKLALKYLSKKSADLVLLDYLMPIEDGPAVLQQIRESSPHCNIPVVFLTGVDDKDLVMKGLKLHPNSYLLKPVSRAILLERVTEILLGL